MNSNSPGLRNALRKSTDLLINQETIRVSMAQKENFRDHILNLINNRSLGGVQTSDAYFPSPRSGHSCSAIDADKLILFGGCGGFGYSRRAMNDVYLFSLHDRSWHPLECTGTSPSPRFGHGASVWDGKLFIFGGWSNDSQYNDLFVLDIKKKDWSDLDLSWSVPRWNLSMVLIHALPSSKLFVFGGCINEDGEGRTVGTFSNQLGVLDLDANGYSWDDPVLEEPSPQDRLCMQQEANKLIVPPTDPFAPGGRDQTAMFFDEGSNRLVVFGGWSNRWLDDMWAINISSITGPPYAISGLEPSMGPVSGNRTLRIKGEGFLSQGKQARVQVRFSFGTQSCSTEGIIVDAYWIECKTPNVAASIGAQTVEVRLKIGDKDLTTTYGQYMYFLNTHAGQSLCFGPGILEDGEMGVETLFVIQARDKNGRNRTSGNDQVYVEFESIESSEPIREFSIKDCLDGRYEVVYTPPSSTIGLDRQSYSVQVKMVNEEGMSVPVRGSPFRSSFVRSKAKPKSNLLTGPLVSSFIVKSLKEMDDLYRRTEGELARKLGDTRALISIVESIKSFESRKDYIQLRKDQIIETLAALDRLGVSNEKTEKHLRKICECLDSCESACKEKQSELEPLVDKEKDRYKSLISDFESKTIKDLQSEIKQSPIYLFATGPDSSKRTLTTFKSSLAGLTSRLDELKFVASSFGFPEKTHAAVQALKETDAELGGLEKFWELVTERSELTLHYLDSSLGSCSPDLMEEELKVLHKRLRESKTIDKKSDCIVGEADMLKKWLLFVPILADLRDPCMRSRHWVSIAQLVNVDPKTFCVGHSLGISIMWEVELYKYSDAIGEITDQAKQEGKMEKFLDKLDTVWSQTKFVETPHRSEVCLLKMGDDELEALEDHQVQVQNMCASRFLSTFESQVLGWQKSLANINEISVLLSEVQKSWSFLENLFVYSEEVKKELPEDTDRFSKIDHDVRAILKEGVSVKICLRFIEIPHIGARLEKCQTQLAVCEKSLNDFMERKRRAFPRFFFVSTVDLLDILSNGNTPAKVMPHLPKVFQAVQTYHLEARTDDRPLAVGMESCVGSEYVPFPTPLPLNGKVEVYLESCIGAFRDALQFYSEQSLLMYAKAGNVGRGNWICESVVAQCVLLTNLITWVQRVEQSFALFENGNKNALIEARDESHALLLDLIKLTTRSDLDKRTRQKVMCMITLDAHNRDIQDKLVQDKVQSVDCFQWQAQLKAYFDPSTRKSFIRIADAVFEYGYEYLGNGPRLVVTPLTDRIYVTCTQALHLGMGCAPAGPAGTGKTESTKDLANALGKACFVFNASPEMDYKTMGNIFKGLAASGSWGCFDEFNRLVPEVLSVCSVQFKAVCDAIKARSDRFLLQGDEITIDYGCGVFITMNPGYIGRSNLPSSLSSLFRPVTVMVADFFLIISNCLMSEGFLESDKLAKKFATLYALCGDLLSKSKQYDWGMRAIKSVLVVAGSFKRADPSLSEEAVLMRALRDTNVAKIDGDDLKIFMGLLNDLFPGVDVARSRNQTFEDVLIETMNEMGYSNDADGYLLLKITQLIELLTIRHCIFMMGPPGSFKSAVWKILARAKEKIGEKTIAVDLNPKAISTQELYGYVNMATREWKDGVLSKTMRTLASASDSLPKWIILDGDLDANWIESMNSVMDDNKLLTLPSNERIPLKPNMRMIFEIRDLNFATPATVTRAGVVNMVDYNGVQWKAFRKSWLNRLSSQWSPLVVEYLEKHFEKNVGEVLLFLKKQCKLQIPMVDICVVNSLCVLMEQMVSERLASLDSRENIEAIFEFCLVWAAGGCLGEIDGVDYRKLFSSWYRNDFKTSFVVRFPSSKPSVFDFYVNETTGRFEEWTNIVPKIDYSPSMGSITVPTSETVSLDFVARALMRMHHPVMLIGQSGCGKTQQSLGILKNLDPTAFSHITVNMNYYTDSGALQSMLEAPLEKKAGRLFGPPGKSHLVYFIDDLNMPQLDPYNTQSAIALLKQSLDYRHWYDRQKITLKDISNTQLLCCMNPTAGSFTVDQRLQRHFWTYSVPFPDQASLTCIYSTLLRGVFDHQFKPAVLDATSQILKAGLALHATVARTFRKTAQNIHYEFNIRHLSGVFAGLLQMKPSELSDAEKAVHLWIHESERVYADRLVSQSDVKKFKSILTDMTKKLFPKITIPGSDIVFAPFSKGFDEPCYDRIPSMDRLTELANEALREYNENNPVMDLVLFEDAVKHMARIARIISAPGGHALLVGVGGSGRQSLSKLAGFVCRSTVTNLVISSTYGLTELRNDLQSMMHKAGVKDERVLFILTDTQITNEKFLVYINDLLSCGDVADLYSTDEKDAIRNAVRGACKAEGLSDTPENLWSFFIGRVKNNLRMSLCFSPVGDTMRTRARKFPALINSTVIDWFHPWPKEALKSVAHKFLSTIPSLGDSESTLRKGVSDFMPYSFECVSRLSEKFMAQEKRFAYTTPKSFLELLKLYGSMLDKKLSGLEDQRTRLINGLEKLRSTQAQVSELEHALKDTAVIVEEKAKAADIFATQVAAEKEKVNAEAEKAAIEKAKCAEIAKTVSAQQKSCEEDLAVAIPLVQKAEAALDVLNKKDFQELKSFPKPPPGVDKVCECCMYFLSGIDPNIEVDKKGIPKDPSWKGSQKMMSNPERFLESLKSYKGLIDKGQVVRQNIEKARPLTKDASFTVESMKKKSNAAAGLCEWVLNILMYYDVVESVEPKRAALREATKTLNTANEKLASVEALVADLEAKLANLIAQLDEAMKDKTDALAEADRCTLKLEMARRLIGALGANGGIWESSIVNIHKEIELLPGNVAVAASFVSYLAVFSREYRDACVKDLIGFLQTNNVPLTPNLDPLTILTTEAELARWQTQGLPSDRFSAENGAIVANSQRFCLLLDPQLQGIAWIRCREEERLLNTRMGNSKMVSTFESAIENGKTVLVDNMGESLDAVLAPVIGRNIIRRGRSRFMKLGDKEVIHNDKFNVVLHTMLSNPHYPPEVHAECTIVNFTVTEQGLEEQLLFSAVRLERPDLAKQKADLILQQNEFKVKLAELESLLLEKLANAQGDVLEDTELILSLEDAKRTSEEVREKVVIARETEAIINKTSEYYRPCARRGSLMFFFLMDLQKIHSFYKFSLEAFSSVFTRAIQSSRARPASSRKSSVSQVSSPAASVAAGGGLKKSGKDIDLGSHGSVDENDYETISNSETMSMRDLEMRVDVLTKTVSKFVFSFASRGLFDQHRLTAAVMLCLRILEQSGAVSQAEVDLLIKGTPHPSPLPMPEQLRSWLTESIWSQLKQAELVGAGALRQLTSSMEQESLSWKRWLGEEKAETADLPRSFRDLSPFYRLVLLRILRPDRLCQGLTLFVISKLGPEFVERTPFDIEKVYAESSSATPIFFVLFPGVDPTPVVENMAKRLGIEADGNAGKRFINISMGQGQEQIALNALSAAAKDGGWVMLQNVHLMQTWLKSLERTLESLEHNSHPDFRCILSSEPPVFPLMELVPESILQKSIKIADEAPQDIKSNLRRAWGKFSQKMIDDCPKPKEFKACLFALCFYHSLIVGRKRFGPQGWSRSYPFNDGDLEFSASVIGNYLSKYENVPWPDLRYIVSEIVYGGSVTDALDRRTNNTYVETLVVPELLTNMVLAPGLKSPDPSKMDYVQYTKFIEDRLPAESPQMFGLHPNAEFKFSSTRAFTLLETIQSISGSSVSNSSLSTSEANLQVLIAKYLNQLPRTFDMLSIRGRITDWNPYIIVALQECERMNALLVEIRKSLTELEMGLSGALNITDTMEQLIQALSANKVFVNWEKLAYPSLKPLSSWMADLVLRASQLFEWTTNLQAPKSVWISGLFNPMSYLTAVMQVTARQLNLSLDSMSLRCSVTNIQDPKLELTNSSLPPPNGGVFIHGLFLEGASWEDGKGDEEGYLTDPKLKVLHPQMPVLNVFAVPTMEMSWENMYHCPVYITSQRGSTYLFSSNIRMEPDDFERKWILAGAALLLTDD
jgi:dynein heavy chain